MGCSDTNLTTKVSLPVAWDFTLGLLRLVVARRLSNARAAVAAVGYAFAILPFAALRVGFRLLTLL